MASLLTLLVWVLLSIGRAKQIDKRLLSTRFDNHYYSDNSYNFGQTQSTFTSLSSTNKEEAPDSTEIKEAHRGPIRKFFHSRWMHIEQKWFDYKMHFVEILLTTYLTGAKQDFHELFERRLNKFLHVVDTIAETQEKTSPKLMIEEFESEPTQWFPRMRKLFGRHSTPPTPKKAIETKRISFKKTKSKSTALETHPSEKHQNRFKQWLQNIAKSLKSIATKVVTFTHDLRVKTSTWLKDIALEIFSDLFMPQLEKAIVFGYNKAKKSMADKDGLESKQYVYSEDTTDETSPTKPDVPPPKRHPLIDWFRNLVKHYAFRSAVGVSNIGYRIGMKRIDEIVKQKTEAFWGDVNELDDHARIGKRMKRWLKGRLVEFFLKLVDIAKDLGRIIFEHLKRAIAKGADIEYDADAGRVGTAAMTNMYGDIYQYVD